MATSVIFGHPDASAISPDAIVPISSRQTKTDGSGRDRVRRSDQPRSGTPATGVTLADMVKPSQTIERLPKATMNRACPFWTTFTMTDSSGTMSPVTIWSRSFARILMNFLTLCDIVIRASNCKHIYTPPHDRSRIYIIYKLSNGLMVKKWHILK